MPEIRESCGIVGVFGPPDASYRAYRGLYALQHRGQEGAGIVSSDGVRMYQHKSPGLLSRVFSEFDFSDLPGRFAAGHVRYSTTGSSTPANVQPLLMEYSAGPIAVAHNGNLVNAKRLRQEYESYGSIFQTTTDSEIVVHLLARPAHAFRRDSFGHCLGHLRGAFSLVLLTPGCLMGARDPHGLRPLCLGRMEDGFALASESCALDQIGAELVREVESGELVTIDDKGVKSEVFAAPSSVGGPAHCIFEHIYFARPDSMVFGQNVHMARKALGKRLAQDSPVEADVVVAVPEGGNSAAIGYSEQSGIPLDRGFISNLYVGRTFIRPAQRDREDFADIKINVVRHAVDGKRVVVVDDSVVRGTTLRKRLALLRKAGATEVHLRITCPPHRYPCFYGIDFPTREELVAHEREVTGIAEIMGVDSLGYQSVPGMLECMVNPTDHYCTACFTGEYPVFPEDDTDKFALERPRTERPVDA